MLPCRYGGEESPLILAGASCVDAMKPAKILRDEFKQMTVIHGGQVLGSVSLSMGISASPGPGAIADLLPRAADEVPYCAKAEGHYRIVAALPLTR